MLDLKRLITQMGEEGRFQALNEIKEFVSGKFNECLAEERDSDATVAYIDKTLEDNGYK